MKKFITIFLIIISISACRNDHNQNSESEESKSIQNNSAEIQGDSGKTLNKGSKATHEFCYIEKARSENDPELEELYKKLSKLQTNSDEMSKYPKTSEVLKDITKEIGEIKGLIEYRSLEINAK